MMTNSISILIRTNDSVWSVIYKCDLEEKKSRRLKSPSSFVLFRSRTRWKFHSISRFTLHEFVFISTLNKSSVIKLTEAKFSSNLEPNKNANYHFSNVIFPSIEYIIYCREVKFRMLYIITK
jgi:hypothetical protein